MTQKLPPELITEIAAHPGEAVRVVDDFGRTFYIVPEARFTHLEAVAKEECAATEVRLRTLIAEGDASPDVAAEEARERILKMARDADAKYA